MPSEPSTNWQEYNVEVSGAADGFCDCCGTTTKRVWGFVRREGEPIGAYFVAWTEGKPDHGATFDFILGRWEDGTSEHDRYSTALDFRLIDKVPEFMVVDAENRAISGSTLFNVALKRSDVIGSSTATLVFAVVDAVYMSDGVQELRSWSER